MLESDYDEMSKRFPWCADCITPIKHGIYGGGVQFTPNCDNCDDLIGVVDGGRLYRNNRPGRERVIFAEAKKDSFVTVRTNPDGVPEIRPIEVEKTVAYLQKEKKTLVDYKREAEDIIKKAKALDLPQATGPDDVNKAGTEIAIASDVVPTPFVNYKRPVASPKMEVQVPFETETGVVMPPLPKHECELPKAVITETDKWESKKTDRVLIKDGSTFTCACGKDWFVRVQKVPFHISDYDPQYISSWKPIRWFNFGRKVDLRNRKAQS